MLFRQVARVNPRTHVSVPAIVLFGTMAALIAASGTFAQIINWVTLPVWCFIALAAVALFVLRRRDAAATPPQIRVPGHPWTTILPIAAVVGVVVSEIAIYPRDSIYAAIVAIAGIAVYAIVATFCFNT